MFTSFKVSSFRKPLSNPRRSSCSFLCAQTSIHKYLSCHIQADCNQLTNLFNLSPVLAVKLHENRVAFGSRLRL